MGYPYWDNTILRHEPAASILRAAHGRHNEVITALTKRLRDYTPCQKCRHSGRGSLSEYTASDIASYLLVELHCVASLEPVFEELKRRRAAGRRTSPIAWALNYYHTGPTYEKRLRKEPGANQ